LINAFPNKSSEEIKRIRSNYYKFLGDMVTETVWMFHATTGRIKKRLKIENPEVLNKYFEQGRNVVVVLGHFNSWEILLTGLNLMVDHQIVTIYVPLTDAFLDRKFLAFRTKFGMQVISKKVVRASFEATSDKPKAILFGADQSPKLSKDIHWTTFLNQETAVVKGPEKYARQFDCPVVFLSLNTVKRGYYSVRLEDITGHPKDEPPSAISEKHVRLLDKQIKENPEYWLWSHRRWKMQREPEAVS